MTYLFFSVFVKILLTILLTILLCYTYSIFFLKTELIIYQCFVNNQLLIFGFLKILRLEFLNKIKKFQIQIFVVINLVQNYIIIKLI